MNSSSGAKRTLAVVCLIFFSLGLVTASIGPMLNEFSLHTRSSLASVGAVFTAFFLGALLMQLVNGFFSERSNLIPLLSAGALLAAIGMTGMTLSHPLPLFLISAFTNGLGHGAINLAGNLSIARLFKENRVSAVNFVNIFYSLGAFIGPALVGFLVSRIHTGYPVFWLGAILIFIGGLLLMRISPAGLKGDVEAISTPGGTLRVYAVPLLWVLALLGLFYGGSETGMSGWASTYLQLSVQFSVERAAFITATFFLALTVGRMVCSWLGSRLTALQILVLTLCVTLLGGLLLVAGYRNPVMSVIAILLVGLGYGGTYPTMIALATSVFQQTSGKAVSLIVALGSIGGSLLPGLQGILMERTGAFSTAIMIATLAFLMLLMTLLARWMIAGKKRPSVSALR